MKRFKKLVPIAAALALVVALLVPVTALADPLTNCDAMVDDQTPSATGVTYTIDFTTATELSACTLGSTYSQFNLTIGGSPTLPADAASAYILEVPTGTAASWETGGGAPSADGTYTVTLGANTVSIKYCHTSALTAPKDITVKIVGVTNGNATGMYPIDIATRNQAETATDVDTGRTGYMLRLPGELVCTVRGELVSVTVMPGAVNYGVLPTNAVQNTAQYNETNNSDGMPTPQTQTVRNTGTVDEDFAIETSNAIKTDAMGTDWMLKGAQGSEEFTHAYNVGSAVYDGTASITFTKWSAAGSPVSVETDVPPASDRYLELEIEMPSSTVDYRPHTITVTVLATASTP